VKPMVAKALLLMGAALALLGTLALYNRPDFLVNLADQLWSCF
jgi:multisubunit Na+/H+ antiporter MnhG subunit